MENYVTKLRVDEILGDIEKIGYLYQCLTNKEKAVLFNFQLDDSGYNLKLYFAVLKAAGAHYTMDESYEDYQKIYDKTVEMQTEMDKKEIITDELSKSLKSDRNRYKSR